MTPDRLLLCGERASTAAASLACVLGRDNPTVEVFVSVDDGDATVSVSISGRVEAADASPGT